MKPLVTSKEEKNLKSFLALSEMPEITLTYYELRGYIYGIAITPEVIQPSEWVPVIFGDDMPEHKNEDQAREMMGTLFSVLNKHIAAFQEDSLYLPFDLSTLDDNEFGKVVEWTSGFDEALSLRPECWEEQEGLSDEELEHLTNSLIVLEGIIYPEDAVDMFDHLPKGDLVDIGVPPSLSEVDKVLHVQFFLLQALELSVETITQHGAKLEQRRKEKILSSATPFEKSSSNIERNADCPCGSGKKFKQCCSLPPQEKKKKGELIKVNFPQHGKKKKQSVARKSPWSNYQLEVTLAGVDPEVRRVVQVPSNFSLADLHTTIQLAMGWQDRHMHQFQIGARFYGPQLADDYAENALLDETRFSLVDFESKLLQGVIYTYDFGDDWQHVILLTKVIPEGESLNYPVLLGGERACPPEDIGGVPLYQALLDYLENPDFDEELTEIFKESGLEDFDPDYFSSEEVNRLLTKVYGGKKQ